MTEFILITLATAAIIISASYYCYENGIKVPLFGRLIESDGNVITVLVIIPVVNVVFLTVMAFLFLAKFIRGKII